MRIRTLALALALVFGTTVIAEANQAKRPVIHRTARKGTVRKSRTSKARKARRGKTIKAFR
ncbi:MAG TPA: hypothetical protein VGZ73_23355 [Bryobacteraceae bacterium]|jgi:hypothetical protein|nr:hypothetical protein [Bryobacteraceae bacterium]